jgi:hypothetical protein
LIFQNFCLSLSSLMSWSALSSVLSISLSSPPQVASFEGWLTVDLY